MGFGVLVWLPTLSATDISNPIASPSVTTTYIAYDENACGAAQVEVTVEVSEVTLELSTPGVAICLGDGINITAEGGEDYASSPPLGISDHIRQRNCISSCDTQYTITAIDQYGCEDSGEVLVTVVQGPPEGIVHDPISICQGYGTSLPASDGDSWLWSPYVNLSSNNSQFPYATPESSITYTCDIQNLCGIGTDEVTVNVIIPEAYASKDGGICRGDEFPISASGNDPESTLTSSISACDAIKR